MMYVLYFSLALVLPMCLAQEGFSGSCKDFNTEIVQNFDVAAYLGVWHENRRFEAIFQTGLDCVTANYTLIGDNKVEVVNGGKYLSTGATTSIVGVAHQENPEGKEGKLKVRFPLSPEANYWIIGTDYKNWAIVWSCIDLASLMNFQFLWVLTREAQPSENTLNEISSALGKTKLDQSRLRKTNNDPQLCKNKS